MDSQSTLNRLHVNQAHSLIFRDVLQSDSGFYFCLGLEGQEAQKKYNYLVDSMSIFNSSNKKLTAIF